MFYLVSVLIGRNVKSLNKPFSYYTLDERIKKGERVLVPFGKSKETMGFVLSVEKIQQDLEAYQKSIKMGLLEIKNIVDNYPLLDDDLLLLAAKVSDYYKADLMKVLQTMLPPSLKPTDRSLKKTQGLKAHFIYAVDKDISSLNRRERELYLEIKKKEKGVLKSRITKRVTLQALLEKGFFLDKEESALRIADFVTSKMLPLTLTAEQKNAFDTVYNGTDSIYLLQGVTGSGKTEVFMQLAEEYLKEKKSVLVLSPEIALTDKMSDLFYMRFQESLSLLHSSLSDGRKYEEYQRISSGQARIVLGTRSAIFAPLKDLALIIIDEEHSSSYKQDQSPFYDAIKTAIMRSEISNCKVLLASATPRIIDKAKASKGYYHQIQMTKRISLNQNKEIAFVDMNLRDNIDLNVSSIISLPLIEEINKTLERREQVMILLNRRGYSPIYICRNCGQTFRCPNCNIPLNYHKRRDELVCHHCDYHVSTVGLKCPCGNDQFLKVGYGTERAYEELCYLFPSKKIMRLDSDVSKTIRQEVLAQFAKGECDILVGTEVISKGFDFPNVTLTALLDADSSLRIPSYLASERTFDLIAQFVGRSGRKDKKGKALLQTYSPDNEILKLAAKQDYEAFFNAEIKIRKIGQYPPYTLMTLLTFKGYDLNEVSSTAHAVYNHLLALVGSKRFNLVGPLAPYIPYVNGRYYRTILVKYKSQSEWEEVIDSLLRLNLFDEKVEMTIDVDPSSEGA